nr:TraM recognition domain-containing protein [Cellulomonas endophytica]
MKKLWSASNVRTYGGGSSDTGFLEDLSRTIGDYDRATASVPTGAGRRTVSQQLHRERIMDVADLAALPRGRAVVFASGSRPTLIATQPWSTGRHAEAVKASIARHDPQPETTLAAAQAATAESHALERADAVR